MGKETFWDKIKGWWNVMERRLMNYLLKKHGYNFGKYYGEELEVMYQKHKKEINFGEKN